MKYGEKYTNNMTNRITGETIPHTSTYRRTAWGRFHTNDEGDGLWNDNKQILGTCDFTVRGCSTKKSAVAKIRKYVKGE